MDIIKYLQVYNGKDGYGSFAGCYSSEEKALELIIKSRFLEWQFIWAHQNFLTDIVQKQTGETFNKVYPIEKKSMKYTNISISKESSPWGGDEMKINGVMTVKCYNEITTEEVKEEGKAYIPPKVVKTDPVEKQIELQIKLDCGWVEIKLNGIPEERGTNEQN